MKKLKATLVLFISLFAVSGIKAQTKDFYPGTWDVMIFGTPYGDVKRTFVLERKEGKLGGVIKDSTGAELTKITKVTENGKTAAIDFTSQDYDVTLTIDPVDEDHVKGNLAGFTTTGVRRKEH
ncbi:hypothetical protein SAMN05428949_6769 [Chitinophaga sp. YR627]|uniref:hypothetical protein n=1 Tax=Chitinophaga sp. YR627 TaxID=1881041 RepID=UPI0008EA0FF2|nr:hypothetical protein [Chitinophaga sp. YR627]SFO85728.1 hypothetical protein SAMN05428949_6769 [Chitinophaga sp. YR627]